jgi:hypothetical protein
MDGIQKLLLWPKITAGNAVEAHYRATPEEANEIR